METNKLSSDIRICHEPTVLLPAELMQCNGCKRYFPSWLTGEEHIGCPKGGILLKAEPV